jgi:hypothetical protein
VLQLIQLQSAAVDQVDLQVLVLVIKVQIQFFQQLLQQVVGMVLFLVLVQEEMADQVGVVDLVVQDQEALGVQVIHLL